MKLHLHSILKRYSFLRIAKLNHQRVHLVQEICDEFITNFAFVSISQYLMVFKIQSLKNTVLCTSIPRNDT